MSTATAAKVFDVATAQLQGDPEVVAWMFRHKADVLEMIEDLLAGVGPGGPSSDPFAGLRSRDTPFQDIVERAKQLVLPYFAMLPEPLRTKALCMEGDAAMNRLMDAEGTGVTGRAHTTFPCETSSLRPPIPDLRTPKEAEDWFYEVTGQADLSVDAKKEKYTNIWHVRVSLGGQEVAFQSEKTRKAAIQEAMARWGIWSKVIERELKAAGWKAPTFQASGAGKRAHIEDFGRHIVDNAVALAEYRRQFTLWERSYQSWWKDLHTAHAALHSYMNVRKLRNLRDLKAALPEGWEARSGDGTYSISSPKGNHFYTWATRYGKYTAEDRLALLVRNLDHHVEQPERYSPKVVIPLIAAEGDRVFTNKVTSEYSVPHPPSSHTYPYYKVGLPYAHRSDPDPALMHEAIEIVKAGKAEAMQKKEKYGMRARWLGAHDYAIELLEKEARR